MKDKKRALRRHHKERVYLKRRERIRRTWWSPNADTVESREAWLDKMHWMKSTGTPCSCWMCSDETKYRTYRASHKRKDAILIKEFLNDIQGENDV
jgi:hypothetical protein